MLYSQCPRNILDCYTDKWLVALRTGLVCLSVWRGTCYAPDIVRRRFDGLEEDIYIECWKTCGAGVDLCYGSCEGLFGGGGGEGARWVIDYPERHGEGP
jgi:hypothetical protein